MRERDVSTVAEEISRDGVKDGRKRERAKEVDSKREKFESEVLEKYVCVCKKQRMRRLPKIDEGKRGGEKQNEGSTRPK